MAHSSSPTLRSIEHSLGFSAPRQHAYYAHVDGLRAVAILAVVIYHAAPQWLTGGFIGVDVFFVLSGFLITRLIAREIATETFSLVSFYARRIRRLLPAATVTLVGVAGLAYFILLPDAYQSFGKSLSNTALFVSNFYFMKHSGYFDAPAHLVPLLHTWSLSVEEQFYVFWPILLAIVAPKVQPRLVLAMGVILCLASLAFAQYKLGHARGFVFYMLVTRFWELGIGALLALTIERIALKGWQSEAAAVVGVAAIITSAAVLTKASVFPGLAAVPACLGTALVIAAGARRGSFTIQSLSWRPVVFIGLISYSLYLWHWPLLALARYYAQRGLTPIEITAVISLSVIAAILSWRFVERPFRRPSAAAVIPPIAKRGSTSSQGGSSGKFAKYVFDDTQAVRVGALVIVLSALLGGAINWGEGWPWRLQPQLRQVFQNMGGANELRRSCDGFDQIFANDERCNFGRKKQRAESYQLALMGDSNGDHFVPVARAFASRANLAGRQVTQSACPPILGVANSHWRDWQKRNCLAYQSQIMKFVDANPDLKFVILSASWQAFRFFPSGQMTAAGNLKGLQVFQEQAGKMGYVQTDFRYYFAATVLYLRSHGISVLLLGQVPHYYSAGGLPIRCVANALKENKSTRQCNISKDLALKRLLASERFFESLAARIKGVSFFSPSAHLCKDGSCSPLAGGTFLYRDPGHLSSAGARYFANLIPFPEALR